MRGKKTPALFLFQLVGASTFLTPDTHIEYTPTTKESEYPIKACDSCPIRRERGRERGREEGERNWCKRKLRVDGGAVVAGSGEISAAEQGTREVCASVNQHLRQYGPHPSCAHF